MIGNCNGGRGPEARNRGVHRANHEATEANGAPRSGMQAEAKKNSKEKKKKIIIRTTSQIGECISQLSNHFKPDPRHIKKRIEDLIAREYIERDAEKQNLYRYVA